MRALIKRYFFVVNLLFVAAAAYLLARGINKFVGYYLAPPFRDTPTANANEAPPPKPDKKDERLAFNEATERNIFGAKRETLVPPEEQLEEKKPEVDTNAAPVPSTLRIRLVSTTVFFPAEWSLAQIEDVNSKEVRLYSINGCEPGDAQAALTSSTAGNGDSDFTPPGGAAAAAKAVAANLDKQPSGNVRSVKLPAPCNRLLDTARITGIERERVVFINEQTSRTEYLDFTMDGTNVAAAAPKLAEVGAAPAGGPTGAGIKKTGANSYEVQQAEIDSTLANLNNIATQARIVPSFQDGKANGFKLFSIRPDSLYAKIGIQNGDVISRINGYELTSPDKALEIYSKLKDSKQITVDLQRRGQNQTLDYSIVR